MKSISKKPHQLYGALCSLAALLLLTIGVIAVSARADAQSLQPATGQHLISLHDNGREKGILTEAGTIREALAQAGISVDPNDLVEPGLDEQLLAAHYEVNIYRARPVTVVDGAIRQKVMSPYQTPQQIAEHAGISLHDEDTTVLSANTDMVSEGAGMQLAIDRATELTLLLYGQKTTVYTHAPTVAELLQEKKITLGADDTLSIAATTPITKGMTVELWRNGKQTASEEREVAFTTEKIKDMDREVGYREIKEAGVAGKKTVTFEIEMKNGHEVSRKEIQSVVTKEPKKQVEIVGGKLANTFSGSFAEALARLRSCEGSYTTNTGNGYYGAYQFDKQTWGGYGGYAVASEAPASVQDEKAWQTYQRRGWQPWPSCSRSQGLQDIYR